MSKFLSYLRNDKGGAVEYVLVTAAVGALVVGIGTNQTAKNAINGMVTKVFTVSSDKVK